MFLDGKKDTKNRTFLYKLLTRFNKIPKRENFVKSKKGTDILRVKIYFTAIIVKYMIIVRA